MAVVNQLEDRPAIYDDDDDEEWPDFSVENPRLRIRPGSACTSRQSGSTNTTPRISGASTPPLRQLSRGSGRKNGSHIASIFENMSAGGSSKSFEMESRGMSSRAHSDVVAGMLDRCCNMLEELVRTPTGGSMKLDLSDRAEVASMWLDGESRTKRQRTKEEVSREEDLPPTGEPVQQEPAAITTTSPTGRSIAMKLAKVCAFLGESEAASLAAERTLAELRPGPGREFPPDSYELFVQAAGLVEESKVAIANASETLVELQLSLGESLGSNNLIANTSILVEQSRRMSAKLERTLTSLSQMAGHDLHHPSSSSGASAFGSVHSLESTKKKRTQKACIEAIEGWVDALVDDPMLGVEIPSGASSVRSVLDRAKGVETSANSGIFSSVSSVRGRGSQGLYIHSVERSPKHASSSRKPEEAKTTSVRGLDDDAVFHNAASLVDNLVSAEVAHLLQQKSTQSDIVDITSATYTASVSGNEDGVARSAAAFVNNLVSAEVAQLVSHKSVQSDDSLTIGSAARTISVHGTDSDALVAANSEGDRMMSQWKSIQHSEVMTESLHGADSSHVPNSEVDRMFCKEMSEMFSGGNFGSDEVKAVRQAVGKVLSGSAGIDEANFDIDGDSESCVQSLAFETSNRMFSGFNEEEDVSGFAKASRPNGDQQDSLVHSILASNLREDDNSAVFSERSAIAESFLHRVVDESGTSESADMFDPEITAYPKFNFNVSPIKGKDDNEPLSPSVLGSTDMGSTALGSTTMNVSSQNFHTGMGASDTSWLLDSGLATISSEKALESDGPFGFKANLSRIPMVSEESRPETHETGGAVSVQTRGTADEILENRVVDGLLNELQFSAVDSALTDSAFGSVRTEASLEERMLRHLQLFETGSDAAIDTVAHSTPMQSVRTDGSLEARIVNAWDLLGDEDIVDAVVDGPEDLLTLWREGKETVDDGPPDLPKDGKHGDDGPPDLPGGRRGFEEPEGPPDLAKRVHGSSDGPPDVAKRGHGYSDDGPPGMAKRVRGSGDGEDDEWGKSIQDKSRLGHGDDEEPDEEPGVKSAEELKEELRRSKEEAREEELRRKKQEEEERKREEEEKLKQELDEIRAIMKKKHKRKKLKLFAKEDATDQEERLKMTRELLLRSYHYVVGTPAVYMDYSKEGEDAPMVAVDDPKNKEKKKKNLRDAFKSVKMLNISSYPKKDKAKAKAKAKATTEDKGSERRDTLHDYKFDEQLLQMLDEEVHDDAAEVRKTPKKYKMRNLVEGDWMEKEREARYDLEEAILLAEMIMKSLSHKGAKGKDLCAKMEKTKAIIRGALDFNPLIIQALEAERALRHAMEIGTVLSKDDQYREAGKVKEMDLMLLAALKAHNEATVLRVLFRELRYRSDIETAALEVKDLAKELEEDGHEKLARMVENSSQGVRQILGGAREFMLDPAHMVRVLSGTRQAADALRKAGRPESEAKMDQLATMLEAALLNHHEIMSDEAPGNRPDTFDLKRFMQFEKVAKSEMKESIATGKQVLRDFVTLLKDSGRSPGGTYQRGQLIAAQNQKINEELLKMLQKVVELKEVVLYVKGQIMLDQGEMETCLREGLAAQFKMREYERDEQADALEPMLAKMESAIHQHYQATLSLPVPEEGDEKPKEAIEELMDKQASVHTHMKEASTSGEKVLDALKEQGLEELVDVVSNAMEKVNQARGEGVITFDERGVEAALEETAKAAKKLRAEGQTEEADKMKQVAEDLQASILAHHDAQTYILSQSQEIGEASPAKVVPALSQEGQQCVEKELETVLEALAEQGREGLVDLVVNTVEKVDQVMTGVGDSVDVGVVEAALNDVVQATEKLREEGQLEEAAKMERVAEKLQECLEEDQATKEIKEEEQKPPEAVQVSQENQEFVEKKMETILEKLQQDGHGELVEIVVNTVEKIDEVISGSSGASASDVKVVLEEVNQATEKLKAEGQLDEAQRLQEVAEKLQVCLTNEPEIPEEQMQSPEIQISQESQDFMGNVLEQLQDEVQMGNVPGDLGDIVKSTAEKVAKASSNEKTNADDIKSALDEVNTVVERLKAEGQLFEANKMEQVADKLQESLSQAPEPPPQEQIEETKLESRPELEKAIVAPLSKMFVNKQLEGVLDKLKQEGRDDMVEMISKVDEAFKTGVNTKDAQSIETALDEAKLASEKLKAQGQEEEAAKMEKVVQKLEDSLSSQRNTQETSIATKEKETEKEKEAPVIPALAKVFVNKQLESVLVSLQKEDIPEIQDLVQNVEQAFKTGLGSNDALQLETALADARLASQKLKVEGQSEEAAKMEKVAQKLQDCLSTHEKQQLSQPSDSGERQQELQQAASDDQVTPQWLLPSPFALTAKSGLDEEPIGGTKQLPALKTPPKLLPGVKPPRGMRDSRSEPNLQKARGTQEGGVPPEFRNGGKKGALLPSLDEEKSAGSRRRHKLHKSKMTESLPSIMEGSISNYDYRKNHPFSAAEAERAIKLLRKYNVKGGIDVLEMLKDGCLPQFFCRPL